MIRSGAGSVGREQICIQCKDMDNQKDDKDADKTEAHRDKLLQER